MALLPYVVDNFSRLLSLSSDPVVAEEIHDLANYIDKNGFSVSIDVQHFKPEEILVKTNENCVTIEAKHDEDFDEHGFVTRQFIRRFILPNDIDMDQAQCSLSSDGILTVKVPKKFEAMETNQRDIPIELTYYPAVRNAEYSAPFVAYPANIAEDGYSCSLS